MADKRVAPKATAANYPAAILAEGIDPEEFTTPKSRNPNEAHNRQPLAREILAHQAQFLAGMGCFRIRNNTGGQLNAGTLGCLSSFVGIVEEGDASNQLSSWDLVGVTLRNSSAGRLWWTLTDAAGDRTVKLYSRKNLDTAANGNFSDDDLVASGTLSGDGTITLNAQGGSGISGSVDVVYSGDDTDQNNVLYVHIFDIAKAQANDRTKSAQFVLAQNVADEALGYAYAFVIVTGLDTSAFAADGARIYLSDTPGALAASPGTYPQDVGLILHKDASDGIALLTPGGLNPWARSGQTPTVDGIEILDAGGDHVITLDTVTDEGANRTLTIPPLGGPATLMVEETGEGKFAIAAGILGLLR